MNKHPSFKQLQHLIALHHYQHFGQAAAACFVSQSTLSASILNLENTLDIKLLERNHKTFLFTPLGEEIVRRSKIITEKLDELVDYTKTEGRPMQGTIYIGIIPTIAPFVLSELQIVCQENYPDLNLFIREDTSDNLLKYLGEGKLDFVLMALPYSTENLYTQVLCKDYFKFVVPKNWLTKGFERKISELPEHSIFLLDKEHCLKKHAITACKLKDSHKINPFFATSLHTLVKMVSHKPGVTFLPTLAIHGGVLEGSELVPISLTDENAYREIGVAWRITSYKEESYKLLAEHLSKILIEKCT